MAKKQNLPKSPFARILSKAGAERVGSKATTKFRDLVEDYADNLAKKIVKNTYYSGRKSVNEDDVRKAVE